MPLHNILSPLPLLSLALALRLHHIPVQIVVLVLVLVNYPIHATIHALRYLLLPLFLREGLLGATHQ